MNDAAARALTRALSAEDLRRLPPQIARAVQAAENLYAAIEEEFGLLSSTEVGRLMGSTAKAPRALTYRVHRAGRLVGIRRARGVLYPGFQFDDTGRPLPVVAALRAVAVQPDRSEEAVIQWLCSPSKYFGGARPVDRLGSYPADLQVGAWSVWLAEW